MSLVRKIASVRNMARLTLLSLVLTTLVALAVVWIPATGVISKLMWTALVGGVAATFLSSWLTLKALVARTDRTASRAADNQNAHLATVTQALIAQTEVINEHRQLMIDSQNRIGAQIIRTINGGN